MLDAGLNFGEKLRTRGLAAVLRRVVEVSPDQYCPADERRSAWQGHLQQHGTRAISVLWPLKANGRLALLANFGDDLLQIASGLVDLHNGGRPHRFA